ncbi:mechanosensitive ion channel family protein [Halorubrum rubrum]|uniref:Mechanosensitive ion channel family protein n=1 Tax=Halorubrum rubrum TaxID=1126240 RepID=A0ABD5R0V2_9EURY|nr:mechanosensitive ion channel family protein [Halorubrum rubrum]
MVPLQFGLSGIAATIAVFLFAAFKFVAGFVAVLVLGKLVFVPGVERAIASRGLDEAVKSLGSSVANAVVWVAAVAIGFTLAGYGAFLSAFAVFGGAIALAVGFAAQDLLGNFVAGIFILKDKPFEVGDWIEWNGNAGRVEDIDLRVSRVRTFDNERITVPNGDLANNAVTNPVAYETLRQKFVFGIGYDDDIAQATDIVVEKAEEHAEILDDPAPSVRVVELGDSAVGLQSRWWIDEPDRGDFVRVRSEYVTAVKEAFDEAGIDMPYVHRQLTGSVEVIESVADE